LDRIAILPFDNLSGDPSLDWVSASVPSILTESLGRSTRLSVFRAASVSEAYQGRASRFLMGTFRREGDAFQFEYQIEDADRHKVLETFSTTGRVLFAATAIARHIDPAAFPFSTSSPEAIEAWGRGDYDGALAIDPDFGAAGESAIQALIAARRQMEAVQMAQRLLARSSLRSVLNRARIRFLEAALRGDPADRLNALVNLAALTPSDSGVLTALGEAKLAMRQLGEASKYLRASLKADPVNPQTLNLLGYAEALEGNLNAARELLEQYSMQPGQRPNGLDSLGEAHFLNGKFKEAAAYFKDAYMASPDFAEGTTLWKAAYAEWLEGDLSSANATMARYLSSLAERQVPSAPLVEASWLYATGRRDEAIARLSAVNPAISAAAERQLLVWKNPQPGGDLQTWKRAYEASNPTKDGMARTFYAAALLQSGDTSAAAKLLKRWPLPAEAEHPLQSLVFPLFVELRKKSGGY
jgi:Flp pilus assembly protein TadD